MLHVTPWLTTEQHRSLIGNDICLILFYDTAEQYETQFDPQVLESLGIVPHVFTVVQPIHSEYLLGFFHRTNLKSYRPRAPPRGYTFTKETIQNYLFTKLYNGYIMTTKCPPVNRLFSTPRKAAIEALGDYFFKKNKKSFLNRRRSARKNSINMIRDKSSEVVSAQVQSGTPPTSGRDTSEKYTASNREMLS
jgi:hypothetical protein